MLLSLCGNVKRMSHHNFATLYGLSRTDLADLQRRKSTSIPLENPRRIKQTASPWHLSHFAGAWVHTGMYTTFVLRLVALLLGDLTHLYMNRLISLRDVKISVGRLTLCIYLLFWGVVPFLGVTRYSLYLSPNSSGKVLYFIVSSNDTKVSNCDQFPNNYSVTSIAV